MAGSGKSHILNHLPLLVVDDPNSSCVMYRETNPMLEDGFWPNGRDIWENLPSDAPKWLHPKIVREQKKEIILENGARIKYKQAADIRQATKDAQGQEVTLYGLDEGTQFDIDFIFYLMSRLRSKSKHFSRMVISCNPDPDHGIRELISYYLKDDGLPDPEKDGLVRYFYRIDGEFVWANSREELTRLTGVPKEDWDMKFTSFSFVSGTIYDNPPMREANPQYQAMLEGLNPVDKARLLHGNWDARPKGANYWEREWVENNTLPRLPYNCLKIRPYDLAATERSQVNKSPDPSACIGMAKDRDNRIIIYGDYHKDTYDEVLQVYGQYCKRSGARDAQIIKQAEYDGEDTLIVLPQDPAAAGKAAFESMAKMITAQGFQVKKDPMPIQRSKLVKFSPFATACELGLVYVVVSSFDKKTLEFIYKQLEQFDGERSTTTKHDEFPDVLASGFNYLNKAKVRPKFGGSGVSPSSASTKLATHKTLIK